MMLKQSVARPIILFWSILLMGMLACRGLSPTEEVINTGGTVGNEGGGTAGETVTNGPAVTTNNPIGSAGGGTSVATSLIESSLESTLVNLYRQVNPSVVHVFSQRGNLALGEGSGFIYDGQGHIVTNNHVVENGDTFEVVFANKERRVAEVVGMDVDSDLAVIKVESLPAGMVPMQLGDSTQLAVGQFVIAIGNPFGEEGSMSLGIVSGLGRSLTSQRTAEGGGRYSLPQVIQTDTAINPGNSGGPLLNLRGEVVGVNSAIRTTTGTNSGVGFAIPVNAVRRVAPSLIANGSYTYPFIGIGALSTGLTLSQQEELGLPQATGAYITSVTPGSGADEAGLVPANAMGQGGDLIIAIDSVPVYEFNDLTTYLIFETEVGQTVNLTIIREGETIDVPLTLGARP
ncbi:MAG TPA: trypsin-like peptidase domain-containing protein [Anaerolineae bacterium]|nr:trypsin-like peptidase domain-containing protein [Anaerolineae bacterium]